MLAGLLHGMLCHVNLLPWNPVPGTPLGRSDRERVNAFQQVPSTWVPLHAYDERAAWDGAEPLHPDQKLHVEAAAFHGKPIYFDTVYAWDQPSRQAQEPQTTSQRVFIFFTIAVFVIAIVGSALIARHNLRLGRGDIKGALRVAFLYFIVRMLLWLFGKHHPGTAEGEFALLLSYLRRAVFSVFYLWLLYIALEPFIRRRWPHRIISWSRLLRGEFRDPLVGRGDRLGSHLVAVAVERQVDVRTG